MARDHSRILMTLAGPPRVVCCWGAPVIHKESSSFYFSFWRWKSQKNMHKPTENDVNQTWYQTRGQRCVIQLYGRTNCCWRGNDVVFFFPWPAVCQHKLLIHQLFWMKFEEEEITAITDIYCFTNHIESNVFIWETSINTTDAGQC